MNLVEEIIAELEIRSNKLERAIKENNKTVSIDLLKCWMSRKMELDSMVGWIKARGDNHE